MLYFVADHAGFELKNDLVEKLNELQIEIKDLSRTFDPHDDYPMQAQVLADFLLADLACGLPGYGIAICRSGQGICMALNRFRWIRAGTTNIVESVIQMRNDNDANVLCIGSDYVNLDQAVNLIQIFLNTPFSNAPRHSKRIEMLDNLG